MKITFRIILRNFGPFWTNLVGFSDIFFGESAHWLTDILSESDLEGKTKRMLLRPPDLV